MRFQTTQFLFIAITSYCSAAKDTLLRGGLASEHENESQIDNTDETSHHGNVNRFLENMNIFDASAGQDERPTQFIVKYISPEAMNRAKMKRNSKPAIMTMKAMDVEILNITDYDELRMITKDKDVEYVEIDPKRYLMDVIRHDRELQVEEEIPYGIDMVKALEVPDNLVANRKVCIVDTGYDESHPDLPKKSDNVSGDNNRGSKWFNDGNGHGTHVAGTIAAVGDNGFGVVGVNRSGDIGLHIIRLFNDEGRPIFGSTLVGLAQKCVDAGSNIISMSLGGPIRSQFEADFFQGILEQNVLTIAAAGNSGNTRKSYPASYDAVMSVAAVDEDQNLAFFSQRNNQVEISAPGVRVKSTQTGGGYIAYSGTSMATPHVAGVAALVWSHGTGLTAEEIREILRASADDLGDPGLDNSYGYGLVRADKAYEMIVGGGNFTLAPTALPTPEPSCSDFPNYQNSFGDGCDWYAKGLFNRCSIFGNGRPNNEGTTGNDACCVCGGGVYTIIESPSISPSPTLAPTGGPTQCVDNADWVNSQGNGCEWYGLWRCFLRGDDYENDGLVANDACCNCK